MSDAGIYLSNPAPFPTLGVSFVRISMLFESMYRIVSSMRTPKCLSSSGISFPPSNYTHIRSPPLTYNPGSTQNATPGTKEELKGMVGVS